MLGKPAIREASARPAIFSFAYAKRRELQRPACGRQAKAARSSPLYVAPKGATHKANRLCSANSKPTANFQLDFGAGWSLKKAFTSGIEGVD